MTHRFPSIAQANKLAYVYDSTRCESAPISARLRFYETMGDGMIAHTPSAPISIGMLTDFLFSLAKAMTTDQELCEAAAYEIRSGIASYQEVEFGLSVVFRQGKRRWYSRKERKVSASEAKRNDRRYEEITERFDGTAKGAYNALWQEYHDGIRMLGLAYSILRYLREVKGNYCGTAAGLLQWDNVDQQELDRAFETAIGVIQAHDFLYQSGRMVASYEKQLAERAGANTQEVAQ